MTDCLNENSYDEANNCCKSKTGKTDSYCKAYDEGTKDVCQYSSIPCSWGTPSPTPPTPPPTPTPTPTPGNCLNENSYDEANNCCKSKTGKTDSYCKAYDEGTKDVCQYSSIPCSWGTPSPPGPPPGPPPPSPTPSGNFCQQEWSKIPNTIQGSYTSCNSSGGCSSPHGYNCCVKDPKNPDLPYPCSDPKVAKFCATYVDPKADPMKNTKCPVTWARCNFDTGSCEPCDPRTDMDCKNANLPSKDACNKSGCFKIPKIKGCNSGWKGTKWKLPMNSQDAKDNGNYLTMWAEGAGGIGEGTTGATPQLVQYYRGMADFFCRVGTDKQILPCNRLQLRVENPYIDGGVDDKGNVTPATSMKNMYYPSENSPIYTELLKNLPPEVTVQIMPWTHEPWLAYQYECNNSKYANIFKSSSSCSTSSIPCYPTSGKASIYKNKPTCSDGETMMNGDCYTIMEGKCVNNTGQDMCNSNQVCAQKRGQKYPGCITQCCTSENETPMVCDGSTRCCKDESDCPKVPALAVCLADMWNDFLQKQSGYSGPFITGIAFDAEGSGYAVTELSQFARNAIYHINGMKNFYQININNEMQHFVLSVTQGNSFGGLSQKTVPDSVTDNDSLDDVVNKVNEVLQNGDKGQVPTIADEVLPEYYNVIDGCTQPGKPVLVDSLPNWKYPDFAATKNCGKNFQPYVGEKQYLWDGGSTFKCGDPKIMDDTGCGTGLKENFELNCEDAPQGAKCQICVDPTYSSVACQGINQSTCHSITDEPTCSNNTDCYWDGDNHGGTCNDKLFGECSAVVTGLEECLNNGAWDNSKAGCSDKKSACENCSGCTAPSPPPPSPPSSSTCPQGEPSDGKQFPCCGCGYSPSSIYLSAWNADQNNAADIIWKGTQNNTVYSKANLKNNTGPLKHFIIDGMSSSRGKDKFGVMRTCALLSVETSHGMGKSDCLYPIYPASNNSDMLANCGIPNAFGVWTGSTGLQQFIQLCDYVKSGPTEKVGVEFGSVGVFSYPLLPLSWLDGFEFAPKTNKPTLKSSSSGMKLWKIALIVLGVMFCLFLLYLLLRYLKFI